MFFAILLLLFIAFLSYAAMGWMGIVMMVFLLLVLFANEIAKDIYAFTYRKNKSKVKELKEKLEKPNLSPERRKELKKKLRKAKWNYFMAKLFDTKRFK